MIRLLVAAVLAAGVATPAIIFGLQVAGLPALPLLTAIALLSILAAYRLLPEPAE